MSDRGNEFGRTVADARLLARKCQHVFIFFGLSTKQFETGVVMLSRKSFLNSISYKPAGERMPCYLEIDDEGKYRLQIGSFSAFLRSNPSEALDRSRGAEVSDNEWARLRGIECAYPDGADRCRGCDHYRDPKKHPVCQHAIAAVQIGA